MSFKTPKTCHLRHNLVVQLLSSISTKLTSYFRLLTSYLSQVQRQSRSRFPVHFQVITVNFLFVLNACKVKCVVSLYFKLNCGIK